MSYVLTLLLTLAVVLVTMWVFVKVGTPVYRLERENIVTLLQLLVSGRATEQDWDVFVAIPIRHDPLLRDIQERCLAIAQTEFVGGSGLLFSPQGITKLECLLKEIDPEALAALTSNTRLAEDQRLKKESGAGNKYDG